MTIKRVISDILPITDDISLTVDRNSGFSVGFKYYSGDPFVIDEPVSGSIDVESTRFTSIVPENINVSIGGKGTFSGFDYINVKSSPNSITGTTTHYQMILSIKQ